MWRNAPVREFLVWLRNHNATQPPEKRCGVFGLDLYSLQLAMHSVIAYLAPRDPAGASLRHLSSTVECRLELNGFSHPLAAAAVKKRYAVLDAFSDNPQQYGYVNQIGSFPISDPMCVPFVLRSHAVATKHHPGCRAAVATARAAVVEACARLVKPTDPLVKKDESFFAEVNARCVEDAEQYYVAMFESDEVRLLTVLLTVLHRRTDVECLLSVVVERARPPLRRHPLPGTRVLMIRAQVIRETHATTSSDSGSPAAHARGSARLRGGVGAQLARGRRGRMCATRGFYVAAQRSDACPSQIWMRARRARPPSASWSAPPPAPPPWWWGSSRTGAPSPPRWVSQAVLA